MQSFLADDGVFCTVLSGFTTRQEALQAGFRWLAPILMHDPAAVANERELALNRAAYEREGWRIAGWGTYGQAASPEADAHEAAALVRKLSLQGWIANGEAWAEGAQRGYSRRFITAWQAEHLDVPLAVSCLSSETANFPRDFDYQAWLAVGAAVMPQVYGNDNPNLTVAGCLGSLGKAHVPQHALNLTFGTYPKGGEWTIPFQDYQGWSGPRSVYVGDATPAAAWAQLARSAARPHTPPEEEIPVPPLTEKQVPYTGPYTLATGPGKSKGPTAEAMKRALSRAGFFPWREFDQHYNAGLEAAWDAYDHAHGVTPEANGYGKGRWERLRAMAADSDHPGEHALDTYAITLIQNEAGATDDSDPLANLQHHITAAAELALANASRWRYDNRFRPVPLNIDPARPTKPSDCSGSIIQLVDRARRDSGLAAVVQDPARQGWSGYGNTDQWMTSWPHVASPFRVGDLAHFVNERHVIMCIKAGTVQTAEWWSFGHEPPVRFRLPDYNRYPGEYLFTVRPDYIPSP